MICVWVWWDSANDFEASVSIAFSQASLSDSWPIPIHIFSLAIHVPPQTTQLHHSHSVLNKHSAKKIPRRHRTSKTQSYIKAPFEVIKISRWAVPHRDSKSDPIQLAPLTPGSSNVKNGIPALIPLPTPQNHRPPFTRTIKTPLTVRRISRKLRPESQ